ncbi:Uncharacterised protein [Serratia liquefaciens]|nr:Uncharacterised protein [Serratia liquefaciens]
MARITRPLTNNEILKTKPREKTSLFMMVMACSYSLKPLVKSFGASVTNVQ